MHVSARRIPEHAVHRRDKHVYRTTALPLCIRSGRISTKQNKKGEMHVNVLRSCSNSRVHHRLSSLCSKEHARCSFVACLLPLWCMSDLSIHPLFQPPTVDLFRRGRSRLGVRPVALAQPRSLVCQPCQDGQPPRMPFPLFVLRVASHDEDRLLCSVFAEPSRCMLTNRVG